MDKVVHFEIPFDDKERTEKFYSEVFDWKLNPVPEMEYTMVHTVEVDDQFMLKEGGAINGGLYQRNENLDQNPVIVINAENLDEKLEQIKNAGGEIFKEKRRVGDMGRYAQVKDTEGNIIGV